MRLLPLLALLAGCVSMPNVDNDIAHTHHVTVKWHEVKDGRIAAVCARVRGDRGDPRDNGCHYFDGQVSHIYTPIVRKFEDFCTVGHEVGHSPKALGRFHDQHGNWRLRRD